MSNTSIREAHQGTCMSLPWQPLHAELVVWLPKRPSVRREILDFGTEPAQWILRPDGSGAEASLRFDGRGLLATLRGPERADLEIDFIVPLNCPGLPVWAIAHGSHAEMSIWDHVGRLSVPDVLARLPDAENLRLDPGRYTLHGSVERLCSIVLGFGVDAAHARVTRDHRAAG
jgi:hypothetical protein